MKKIKDFYNNHKVISWVLIVFFGLVLLDSIINNDYNNMISLLYSFGMLCVYLFILYLMTSRKKYFCPKCNANIEKNDSSCKNCGEKFSQDDKNTILKKRVFLKNKLFCLLGETIAFIPLGLGFLYLIFSPIVFATNGEEFSVGNTLFVCYTNPNMLAVTVPCSVIGFILVLIGFYYKKKER